MTGHVEKDALRGLSVGETARRSGLAVSALHFYERQGLIESWRNRGNQRRYARSVLRKLAIIKVAQMTGVPLAEIRDMLATLPQGRAPDRDDWAAMSASWQQQLSQRIALLTRLRDQLGSCIGCGCLSLSECPLRNPGDIAGAKGPGARIFDQ